MAESKSKKRILNAAMVAMAAVVVVAGFMVVSGLKAPKQEPTPEFGATVTAVGKVGNVNIERGGVGYSLDEGSALQDGDLLATLKDSSITVAVEGASSAVLDEGVELALVAEGGKAVLDVRKGEAFIVVEDGASQGLLTSLGGIELGGGSVVSLSCQSGAVSAQVLAGLATSADGTVASQGKTLSLTEEPDGSSVVQISSLSAESLSDFALGQAQGAIQDGESLFLGLEEIETIVAKRAEERAAQQASADQGAVFAAGSASSPDAGSGSENSGSGSEMKTCTIEIRCDTILDNMGNLTEGKSAFVPANGTILARSTVQFSDGDTVFDVLKAVCAATGLHIEYSYTPLYESYYIEGINNLYEFDCGSESGWTYKVNGWFPNYGCSSYELEDGDSITWCYTCNGLGADVGGSMNR